MSNALVLSKEVDFSKLSYWEPSTYFESEFLVIQLKDANSAYRYSIGKVWKIPFLPGFGDTRYDYQEVSEGFNLIRQPGVSRQWKIAIQPFSKVGKLQIKIFTAEYRFEGDFIEIPFDLETLEP